MSGPTELIRQNCPLATVNNDGLMSAAQVQTLEEALGEESVQFWVNPSTGNDANTGTQAAPFQSFDHAWDQLPALLKGNNNRLYVTGVNDCNQERYTFPQMAGKGTPLIIVGEVTDLIGDQVASGASAGGDYVCTVDPVVADDALRGAYLRNVTNGVRILVDTNVTVLGVCTITVVSQNGLADAAPGDEFVVERPSVELRAPQFGTPTFFSPGVSPGAGLIDVKFSSQADPGFDLPLVSFNGSFVFEAIEFDGAADGRGVFGASGTRWRYSDATPWSGDTSVPFDGANVFAGFYLHNDAGLMAMALNERSSLSMTLLGDDIVYDFEIITDVFIQSISGRAVTIYMISGVTGFIRRGKIDGDLFGDLATIMMTDDSTMTFGGGNQDLEITGAQAGAGIYAEGLCNVVTNRVIGTNTDFGIIISGMSLLRTTANTLITGGTGNLSIAGTTKAYADLPFGVDYSRGQ